METMAKRLQRLRLEKKMSQKEIAELLTIPTTTYRDWEYGRGIQGEPYVKLAEIFQVSLSEILGVDSLQIRQEFLMKLKALKWHIEDIEKDIHSIF